MWKTGQPAPFLSEIDSIIFDMDGVITSEQNYWNAAALTVHEMLTDHKYFGNQHIKVDLSQEEIKEIRNSIFVNDQLIALLKDRGVNTNWDLAYVVMCMALIVDIDRFLNCSRNVIDASLPQLKPQIILKMVNSKKMKTLDTETTHYPLSTAYHQSVYEYISDHHIQGFELYKFIEQKLSEITGLEEKYFSRNGELWQLCRQIFQEWYLGDRAYTKTYGQTPAQKGKVGLMYSEQPLIPLEELRGILDILYDAGIRMGIGTGRPFIEIEQPLISWEIKKYFDMDAYITYAEVMKAEAALQGSKYANINLAKPHPYVFLKAIYGKEYSDMLLLDGNYDKSVLDRVLVIGDAGSDIMAAKAIDCKFAAVLTGISGEKARDYFKEMGADYILDSIRDLIV
jgi:phosphoglycolate phosphatase-like HAD superfamily hydrolase